MEINFSELLSEVLVKAFEDEKLKDLLKDKVTEYLNSEAFQDDIKEHFREVFLNVSIDNLSEIVEDSFKDKIVELISHVDTKDILSTLK